MQQGRKKEGRRVGTFRGREECAQEILIKRLVREPLKNLARIG